MVPVQPERSEFLEIVRSLKSSPRRGSVLRTEAVERLAELPGYDSCYIYSLDGDELVLDCYCGEPTEHTRITVGRGICGTAVAENRNQVIPDVAQVENYLCCSMKTKSELVVLIRREAQILGQIDIDGHKTGTFSREDELFLEELARILADRWD